MLNKFKERINLSIGKLGAILKIDLHYIVKGGFWLTTKQFSISIFSLLTTLILAKYFSQENFGIYKYVLSFFSILCLSTATGLPTSIIQWVANKTAINLKQIVYTRIKYGFAGALCGFALSIYYYTQDNTTLSLLFFVISFFVPFFEPFNTYEAVLMGAKKFQLSAKLQTLSQLMTFISVVVTTYFTQNLFYVIVAYFLSTTLSRLLALTYAQNDTLVQYPGHLEQKGLLAYGKHLSLLDILNTISKYIDKLIIFNFIGSQELAIYAMATTPPEYISTFLQNSQYLTLAKISEEPEKRRKLKTKIAIFITISICISLVYISTAPFLYNLVLPNYLTSIPLSQFYAISIFTIALVIPLSLLQARKRIKKMYHFNLITTITNIATLIISVHWGIWGVVCGRMLIKIFNFSYSLFLLSSEDKVDLTSAGTP